MFPRFDRMLNALKPHVTSSWLNPQRVRRQTLLLAIALWFGYAMTIATPGMRDRFGHLKGADFLHAYILGTIALEHRGDALYDARLQKEIGERRLPESSGDYFLPVYGPQYSLIWAPLAALPYAWAAALWMFLSAAIYAACLYPIWRTCPNLHAYGSTVALAGAAFPGFFALITFGQNSAIALAAFTAAYFALRSRRDILAGACLGLLAYKPQLAIVPACVFATACLWPRQPGSGTASRASLFAGASRGAACKVVFGMILSAVVQFGAAWFWYGTKPLAAYVHTMTQLGTAAPILEPKPYLMHSLRAFWNLLLPWPRAAFVLYLVTALAILGPAVANWRRPAPLEHRYAVMLLATVLVAPHLTVYDLVILAPAFLWIADRVTAHADSRLAWLLYLAYLLPFAGSLARWTRLQLSVICFAAFALIFSSQKEEEAHHYLG